VVLVILSPSFPPEQFDTVIEFVFNATNSCTEALTSFTYLGDSRRHLTWMNTREQFDKYFQSSRFDYNSQVQAVFPPELFVAREILRIIGEIDQNPVPHDVGKYILIVTAYELYLRAKITENIRNRLGESRIHVKIIEFDDYNGDSTNSDSAENFLILITENEKIIELDRIDELFNAQLAANVFPCHDRRIDDEISMRVEHEGSNHMHKVAYSNGYEYGANSRADDDESDARDSFWDTPWPYVIGGAILIVLTTISMCFFIIRHSRSLRTNRRIGILKRVVATVNEYYLNEGNQWEINERDLFIDYTQKLGSGAFSIVYKGKLRGVAPVCKKNPSVCLQRKYQDCEVAVKMLPPFTDIAARTDFIQEINLMKSLVYHPHLLCILGVADTSDGKICLVVEYCTNGDLLRFLRNNKSLILEGNTEGLKFKNLLCFAWQISDGLYYLNSKDIIHRDIAARNVLVDGDGTVKIGDFGLCRYTDDSIYRTRGGRLPVKWMAIESLKLYEFTSKSDVWSFGVLLFELFSVGDVPFPEIQPADMIEHLEGGNRLAPPPSCSKEIASLMQKCWLENPLDRPTMEVVREQLSIVLDRSSENYGYLRIRNTEYANVPRVQ
uniref:Protein kinase domain-containing protein n=1 Tax=Parascaris univalens TaxID=6257 RepID=A0A915CG83_PARUN